MPKFKEPNIKWQDSKARKLVLQYLRQGKIPMDPNQRNDDGKRITGAMLFDVVCSMDVENIKYDRDKFPRRLGALRKKIRKESEPKFEEPSIKWQDSQAKKNLTKYLREGSIPLDPDAVDPDGNSITPAIVYKMVIDDLKDEELAKYDKKNLLAACVGFEDKFRPMKAVQKKTENTTRST